MLLTNTFHRINQWCHLNRMKVHCSTLHPPLLFVRFDWLYADPFLWSWVERGLQRVNILTQKHNTMTLRLWQRPVYLSFTGLTMRIWLLKILTAHKREVKILTEIHEVTWNIRILFKVSDSCLLKNIFIIKKLSCPCFTVSCQHDICSISKKLVYSTVG